MSKKQPITIAVPLNCNKHTCGKCHMLQHDKKLRYAYCQQFDQYIEHDLYNRLSECKAAEIKG